jgi:ferric-dicitrate binding protein FerR (iron transport regulator)
VARVEGGAWIVAGDRLAADDPLPIGATLETGADGRAALTFVAGAELRLDQGSRRSLAAANRFELERGAVYVVTAREPFSADVEIVTPLGRVTDVGTRFEVRASPKSLEIRVREGRVLLAHEGSESEVVAGTALRVDDRGRRVAESISPTGAEWDWTQAVSPAFAVEGRSLADYLAWLGAETGWAIAFESDELAESARSIELHGAALAGLRPDRTPALVLPSCGLAYRAEGRSLRIERPR